MINFNENEFIFMTIISKTMIDFDENESAFMTIISKKNDVDNFD